jgi:hypothetical protein
MVGGRAEETRHHEQLCNTFFFLVLFCLFSVDQLWDTQELSRMWHLVCNHRTNADDICKALMQGAMEESTDNISVVTVILEK